MGNTDDQTVTLNDTVAAVLRAERAVAQMTTKGLAQRSGVPERTLMRLLGAERAINVAQIEKLGEAMGLTASYVLKEAERRLEAINSAAGDLTHHDAVTLDRLADGARRGVGKSDTDATATTRRNKR